MSSQSIIIQFQGLTEKSKRFIKNFFINRSSEDRKIAKDNKYKDQVTLFNDLGFDITKIPDKHYDPPEKELFDFIDSGIDYINPYISEEGNNLTLTIEYGAFTEVLKWFIPHIISALTIKKTYVYCYNSSFGGHFFYIFNAGNFDLVYYSTKDEKIDNEIQNELGDDEYCVESFIGLYEKRPDLFKKEDRTRTAELYVDEERKNIYSTVFTLFFLIDASVIYYIIKNGGGWVSYTVLVLLLLFTKNAFDMARRNIGKE